MTFGWAGSILDVDLTTRKVSFRESAPYTRQYLGGRALAARIAWDEIPAGIDAFDPENRIIIARTTKGKGVSFMEYDHRWHGMPPNKEQYERALAELQEGLRAWQN